MTAMTEFSHGVILIPAMKKIPQVWEVKIEERMHTRYFKPSEGTFGTGCQTRQTTDTDSLFCNKMAEYIPF